MEKAKILIVDDEPISVELLEGMLSNNYDIMKAYNGKQALTAIKRRIPDLILLDIVMPDMNGYEICEIIKNNYDTMLIPIIMVTILKEKENRIEAIKAGADDFIIKPIDIDILNARVKSLLRVKRNNYSPGIAYKSPLELLPDMCYMDPDLEEPGLNYPATFQQPPTASEKFTGQVMEELVRSHLKVLILKLLYERPMCGYELVKEIHSKYNVMLSLGAVYPYLYSLKKEGIVNIRFIRGDMRTKIYFITDEGKGIIQRRIDEFIRTEEYLLYSIKTGEINA
ncbi:MAG TPA: response regulator [Candidatus Methanoperedens sp.]